MITYPNFFSTYQWHKWVGHWQYPHLRYNGWNLFKHRFAFAVTTGQSELGALIQAIRYPSL